MTLDTSRLAPDDARAALISLARRWRGLLTTFDEDEDADALVRRHPAPGEPSAHELALGTLHALCWATATLTRIVSHETPPAIGPLAGHVCTPPVRPGIGANELAARLIDDATRAAEAIADVRRAHDWQRTGALPDGSTLSAIDVVRGVVRVAADDLHRAELALRSARG